MLMGIISGHPYWALLTGIANWHWHCHHPQPGGPQGAPLASRHPMAGAAYGNRVKSAVCEFTQAHV